MNYVCSQQGQQQELGQRLEQERHWKESIQNAENQEQERQRQLRQQQQDLQEQTRRQDTERQQTQIIQNSAAMGR